MFASFLQEGEHACWIPEHIVWQKSTAPAAITKGERVCFLIGRHIPTDMLSANDIHNKLGRTVSYLDNIFADVIWTIFLVMLFEQYIWCMLLNNCSAGWLTYVSLTKYRSTSDILTFKKNWGELVTALRLGSSPPGCFSLNWGLLIGSRTSG